MKIGVRALLLALAVGVLGSYTGCRCCQPSCVGNYLAGATCQPLDSSSTSWSDAPTRPADPPSPAVKPAAWQNQEPPGPIPDPNAVERLLDTPRSQPSAPKPPAKGFEMPPELPGADAPPLQLPPYKSDQVDPQRQKAIAGLYPALPAYGEVLPADLEPGDSPLPLSALQQIALENSPVIREAAANVEIARGQMMQAGAYPNPSMGYESDTVGTNDTQGYHGGYLEQTIVTGGKLGLARAAAGMDLASAELALRRARIEVATAVRSAYFATLVAREKMKLASALFKFTDEIYRAHVELVEGGEAAAYEPLQLRVFAMQAQAAVVQAQNAYRAAWRQLAAATGVPDMAQTRLAGRADGVVPKIDYDTALHLMLSRHTDLAIAQNDIEKANILWRLACVTPVPDLDVGVAVQHDFTFDPGTTTYNLTLGGEIPVFNRNRGNITSAQAAVMGAENGLFRVRNDLTSQLADAFARYESSRVLAETFRVEALKDQVRVYRGIYNRYRSDPVNIAFNDVVVAQQNLAVTLTQYLAVLGDEWQAVVDLGELLQVDDLFEMGQATPLAPIPDLEMIAPEESLPGPAGP